MSGNRIDKRDFDARQPLLERHRQLGDAVSQTSRSSVSDVDYGAISDNRRSDGLLYEVAEGIIERDRRRMRGEVIRVISFVWGVITCLGAGSITAFSLYGPLFLTHLHYSQSRVNGVAVAAEIAMYLPVAFFGYLCDRYSPSPVALASGFFLGAGYLLAAFTYKSGSPHDVGGSGWSYGVMVFAFVLVGAGTCAMYGSAVTTCAKNFGHGRHKGIMLAAPIAAFGLSGMWQSQVGAHLLCERLPDGSCGDVDVFRYFLFLAVMLFCLGLGGTFALRLVDGEEEKYIDEAVSELERSGILDYNTFFRPREEVIAACQTFGHDEVTSADDGDDSGRESVEDYSIHTSEEEREERRRQTEYEEEERRKKNWLLNQETRLFLKDPTMWWIAFGFFLVTGPGEAYINNLGTIIQTLTPISFPLFSPSPAGLPSTHVMIIALTSTVARLLTGSITDLFAPPALHHFMYSADNPNRQPVPNSNGVTLSRLSFLLSCGFVMSLGFILLATPFTLNHPSLFHVTSSLVGFGYGASFALMPIIISVVWGVENFGTNWGIVAMVPAAGAAMWGVIYSAGYETAAKPNEPTDDYELCFGWKCYGYWAIGCSLSIWLAIGAWTMAWRGWRKRGIVV